MVKDAFWLARKEIQYNITAIGQSMLVTSFFAMLIAQDLQKIIINLEMNDKFLFVDIMFLLVTPVLAAIFMAGPYLSFRSFKEDPFNKRMALFRSLPIPFNVLALSRTILMLITLLLLSFVFYSTITFVVRDLLFTHLTVEQYLTFVIIWFGYALALGGVNTYIEYGTNGKVLHIFPYVFLITLGLFSFLFYKFVGNGIVAFTMLLSKNIGWPIALLFLSIGLVGCTIWHLLLRKRLSTKDYL